METRRNLRLMTFDEWQEQCTREAYEDYVDECAHRDCTPMTFARWRDNYEPRDTSQAETPFAENH